MKKKSRKILYFCDLPHRKAAEICGVTPRTVERWIQTGQAPATAVSLCLAIAQGRILPARWAGKITLEPKHLSTATGHKIAYGELEAYGWQLVRFWKLERNLEALRGPARGDAPAPTCGGQAPRPPLRLVK